MNKKTILIICGFILAIALTAIITVLIVKSSNEDKITKETENRNNHSEYIIDEKIENEKTDISTTTTTEDKSKDSEKTEINKNESKPKENPSNEAEKSENNTITTVKTEADVVNYIEEISNSKNEKSLKEGFVTVVDFLFYDGEIYGKSFSELTNSAKIKIISLALKIDNKIDEYYPGYKETISSATRKVYTSIKTKLVTLYLDTTVKICNNNPELCEDAKAGLTDLKKNFGITWDFIKDISGIGLTKLKNWYEVWKEE